MGCLASSFLKIYSEPDDGTCYLNEVCEVQVQGQTFSDGNMGSSHGVLGSYRPRGSLARALYDKHQADSYLQKLDKNQWYSCNLNALPEDIASKFVQLEADADTLMFLDRSEEKSDWIMTQIWHSFVKALLGWFMTQTSINGWLQRGSMFVLSLYQFQKLLGKDEKWSAETMLDLGAGDGEVTACLAPAFQKVFVTEVSQPMQALLQRRGYELLHIEEWSLRKYDVISCLNLLDRCDKPLELLHQMHSSLNPGGMVLLALVLPFSPYVESGSPDHKPTELLPIKGYTFEQQLSSFVNDVLKPARFQVISWSRVPYLCEGDLRQSYYWLDDAIFVLKAE